MTDEGKLTLTVEQAAKLLGISRGLAYEMVKMGKIPAIRFGRRVVVPRRALARLLEANSTGRVGEVVLKAEEGVPGDIAKGENRPRQASARVALTAGSKGSVPHE